MAKDEKKKNPILDAEEDTAEADETAEDAADEADKSDEAEEVEAAPKKAAPKAPAKEKTVASESRNAVAALNSDIARTKKQLANDDQVQFFIPLSLGEKKGAHEDVWINGAHFRVPKGKMTMVPQTVANILAEHYQLTEEAGSDKRIDLDANKETALL